MIYCDCHSSLALCVMCAFYKNAQHTEISIVLLEQYYSFGPEFVAIGQSSLLTIEMSVLCFTNLRTFLALKIIENYLAVYKKKKQTRSVMTC